MRYKASLAVIAVSVVVSAFVPVAAQNPNYGGQYGGQNGDQYGRPNYDDRNYDRQNGYQDGGPGFYRESRDRTVYYQVDRRSFCGVQNEQHLRALGGRADQIQTVDRLHLNGRNTGACSWPNGFYRNERGPAVFFLSGYGNGPSGGSICEISSPQQLRNLGGQGRVTVVPGNSDLAAGRQRPRPC